MYYMNHIQFVTNCYKHGNTVQRKLRVPEGSQTIDIPWAHWSESHSGKDLPL